ncbi:hypothetical protein CGCVW01_v005990 [Colletotrichum viniferum]|nr:hypothetical protein CGCVW01_v005990 [Colletotrichum viniferum]
MYEIRQDLSMQETRKWSDTRQKFKEFESFDFQ